MFDRDEFLEKKRVFLDLPECMRILDNNGFVGPGATVYVHVQNVAQQSIPTENVPSVKELLDQTEKQDVEGINLLIPCSTFLEDLARLIPQMAKSPCSKCKDDQVFYSTQVDIARKTVLLAV